jgi:hypothetical protein
MDLGRHEIFLDEMTDAQISNKYNKKMKSNKKNAKEK